MLWFFFYKMWLVCKNYRWRLIHTGLPLEKKMYIAEYNFYIKFCIENISELQSSVKIQIGINSNLCLSDGLPSQAIAIYAHTWAALA